MSKDKNPQNETPTAERTAETSEASAEKASQPPQGETPEEQRKKRQQQRRRKRNAQGVARRIRRERGARLLIHFGIWVGLPTLIACIYYGFIASPQFESTAVVAVQRSGLNAAAAGPLAALVPTTSSSRDSAFVREFIRSRDMLGELIEYSAFLEHFGSDDADRWSRLDADASTEEMYDYYSELLSVEYDAQGTTLTVTMRAFSADKARALLQTILKSSERKVNELSEQMQQDSLAVAEEAMREAEQRLVGARQALVKLQSGDVGINPVSSVETVLGVKAELEGELARAEAELQALRSTLSKQAPEVATQQARVSALRRQIRHQADRLGASGGDTASTPESLLEFEAAMMEKEFAAKAYEHARQALEVARADASQKRSYLVTLAEPSLPSAATYPRRLWKIATVFFVSLALMGVLMLLGAAVREHARV